MFGTEGERLEITQGSSRNAFAAGALRAGHLRGACRQLQHG